MSNLNAIDLSKLPAPNVLEQLDYEAILKSHIDDFKKRSPDYKTLLESDPAIILLQVSAYRELLLRNRINEAAKATMLAYAKDSDLDNLAAFYGVERLVNETDDRLRSRTQLALEGFSTAGPVGAYIFHALSASTQVKSVSVKSPNPGVVLVSILSNIGDGSAKQGLIEVVNNKLNEDDIRPLTDQVVTKSASIICYQVEAIITVYSGPSSAIVENEARTALEKFINDRHKIGRVVAISGIYDALHVDGVKKVRLITPISDIQANDEEAPFCTNIKISVIMDE
ncbi:MAG: baseplate J/gp47 family protein [Proteobacteria bacterium]|nr:baseplate J/gp47 family protein [Pseudomonadota bacterium]